MPRIQDATRDDVLDVPDRDKLSYERKFVAFFDVLGWRDKIEAAKNDPSKVAHLHNVLALFTTLAKQKELTDRGRTRITTFSDNVVLSHSLERQRSLIFGLGMIQMGAAMKGYLVRGGLTAGYIVHNDYVVFGPAVNRAYDLESKVAVYPRIVIDPDWINLFKEPHSFIAEDEGVYFFDFFTPKFSKLFMDVARGIKAEAPTLIDAPEDKLNEAWDLHPLGTVFKWLQSEVQRPLGEPEWRKISWLYERIRGVFGVHADAKSLRRTVLHMK